MWQAPFYIGSGGGGGGPTYIVSSSLEAVLETDAFAADAGLDADADISINTLEAEVTTDLGADTNQTLEADVE